MNLELPNVRSNRPSVTQSPPKGLHDIPAPASNQFTPAKNGDDLVLGTPTYSPRATPDKAADDDKAKDINKEGEEEETEEVKGHQNDGESNSSGGVLISILINILFIASFLMEFRISDANKMNFAIHQEFDQYPISTNPQMFLSDLSKIEDVVFFIESVLYDSVLNPNRTYTPLKYPTTLSESVDLDWYKSTSTDTAAESNDDLSTKVYSNVSTYYFLNSFNLFKGMMITAEYNENYIYTEETPTQAFLSATISQQDAKNTLDKIVYYLVNGYIVSLQMDTIFFNVITQIGLYYDIHFSQQDQANFQVSKSVKPFFPKTFDSDSVDKTIQVLIILFRALFALALIFRIIKVIVIDLYKALKTFFQTQKLELPASLVFNIGVLGLLLVVLILSVYNTINQLNSFETYDVISQSKFKHYLSYANFLSAFMRLLAITICVLVIQILLLLNTQFPTFGVLFHTLGNSKNKLLIYGALVITLMAGFIVFLTLNFGPYDSDMSDFGSSLLLVFEFMIGVVDLDKLNEANEYLGWIYFFVFYLIFNLLVLLLFIVIIISTYVQLRKKLQLTTLALAELAAEKSNKLKEKYIRLLLFKPPPEEVDDEQGPKKGRKRRVQSKKKKNLLEILLFNLEEVDWFGFTNNNRQTRDEIEEEIKNKITEIKFRRMQQKKKKMQDRRSELFEKIYNLAFYIIFIVIYTYTVTFELKVEAAFELNQTIENYYVNTVFQSESGLNKTFYDISTIEDIARWTKEAYLGRIYTGFATESQTATSIIQPYDQNAIFSSSISRINFRNLKTITQTDSSNQNTFTVRVSKDISPSSSYSRNEIITDLTSVDGVLDKPYTFSGTYETYRKHGGYVWVFTRDIDTARTQMAEIQHPQVLNINTGLITMETVYVNRNYQILGLSEFMFEIDSTGDVKNTYKTRTFQVDLYSCDNCTAKLVFEILYLLCVLKQTFDFVKHWFGEWKGTSELTPVNEELKNSPWHVRLINYDLENIKLFGLIFAIGLRIWQILHRMFVTSTNLFKKSYAYLILVMSLILTYVSFYFYGSILSNNLRDSYNVNQAFATLDGQDLALEVGRYEEMSMLFENYSIVQAFNAWLIILRVLFQYGFSRELSLVLELIYEALFDIIFFTAMFVIILLGFSINGYLLFGTEAQSFSDISQSLLQVLLMMISGDNPDDLLAVDKITRAIYFIILVVVCLLILLKMFIAILDGHFTDLTSDSTNNDDLGVFELIVSIVVEKVKAAKIEESYQEIPENTGTLNKWRIKATNALKKLRLKLLRALRRIIFGEEDEIVVTKQEEEGEELEGEKKEKKKKNIEMDLKFNEVEEERRADLQDIEIYLNENEKKKPHDILSSEQNEDDLTVPSKWMNFLEESVTRITNGKINFSKFGTGARDYLNMEVKADQDMSLRFNEIEKKCNEDRPKTIPLVDFYVEYVAIPDYNTNLIKKSIGQVFYERVVDHINFIYHKSIEQASTEKIVESPVDADEGSDSFPEMSALKLSRSRTTLKLNTLAPNRGAYRETKFSDPHENLLKFWDKLKFKHQYALWGGDKASLLTNDIRHCLWKMMKFEGASFGHFIPKDIFEQRGLNQEKIGMKELECIWNNLAENDDNATKDNFGEKESYQAFNPKHIDLIEHVIRANFENIVFELRKFETIKEKINFLKSVKNVKNDPKLMIWLLTSPNIKIEMLLRIQNNVLAEFSMLMLMEEIYDNTYLVQKIEKELDHEMRNRIYMHFFFFANYEASQHSLIQRKEDYLPEQDPDLLEYIGFLEAQLRSTNTAKKRYLDEINRIIKAEEQAKGQDPLLAQSIEKLAIASQAADEEKDMLMRVSQSEVDSNTESVTKSIAKEEGEENVKEQEEPGKKELKVETNFNAKIEIANARAKRLENLKKVNQ